MTWWWVLVGLTILVFLYGMVILLWCWSVGMIGTDVWMADMMKDRIRKEKRREKRRKR